MRPTWQLGRVAVLLTAGVMLTASRARAFRTGEDSAELSGRGRVAWSSPRVGFTLSRAGLPAGLSQEDLGQALAQALEAWKSANCTAIDPYFAGWTADEPASKDGVNTIAWISDWKKQGYPALSPGYTDIQYRGHDGIWEIADADVYLDATGYAWTIAPGRDTSLQGVLTHELGHALGLLHPCELEAAEDAPDCAQASAEELATSMYPLYSAAQASLEADDLSGICYLYPTEGACHPDCTGDASCIEGECRAICGDDLCQPGAACGYWGCASAGSCTERNCEGQPCENDDNCGRLALCKDGVCVGGDVAWGSKCKVDTDCKDGACVDSVCQPLCRNDSECGSGRCAAAVAEQVGGCLSSRAYTTGLRCAEGEDCNSGLCLFTASPAVCTMECHRGSACPREWSCLNVEGRDVCVPPNYQASGGGCALSSLTHNGSGQEALASGALVIGFLARVRRRRRRGLRPPPAR